MTRRPLSEVLDELVLALQPDPGRHPGLGVTELLVDLPVEAALIREPDGLVVLADLPRWRWRSAFDREPGRLRATLRKEPTP